MKCTCNAYDSTYIPLGFLITKKTFGVLYYEDANVFKEIDIFIGEKKCLKCTQRKMYCVTCPNATKKNAYRLSSQRACFEPFKFFVGISSFISTFLILRVGENGQGLSIVAYCREMSVMKFGGSFLTQGLTKRTANRTQTLSGSPDKVEGKTTINKP